MATRPRRAKRLRPLSPSARKGVFDDGRYDQEMAPKWVNDPNHELSLPFYGFDKVALAIDHSDYVEGHYTRWLAEHHPNPASLRGKANAIPTPDYVLDQAWRTRVPEELYPTTYIADRTIEFLEDYAKTPDQPFFVKCSFPDPAPSLDAARQILGHVRARRYAAAAILALA